MLFKERYTSKVPDLIIPKDKMTSFFVYYFARILIKFIVVGQYNHLEPSKNGCLFDFMKNKKDILKSMRPNAICDSCRKEIRKKETKLSESQYNSIDALLTKSGQIIQEVKKEHDGKKRIFIGSSVEGLNIARKIKAALKFDAHVDTWADGLFDTPGKAYIEILEEILINYDFSNYSPITAKSGWLNYCLSSFHAILLIVLSGSNRSKVRINF